jgi:hypothetical protein
MPAVRDCGAASVSTVPNPDAGRTVANLLKPALRMACVSNWRFWRSYHKDIIILIFAVNSQRVLMPIISCNYKTFYHELPL